MTGCVVAARYAPTYLGGLAAYQRALALALGENAGFFLAEEVSLPGFPPDPEPMPWPVKRFRPNLLHRLTSPVWPSLAKRSPAGLDAMARWSWRFSRERKGPVKVVHLVDTGRHFSSFAIAAWARAEGAVLTVWPAVHPGQWGDSPLDLRLYQSADAVFCQSRAEIAHLVARGLEREKAVLCGLPPMGLPVGDGARFRQRHSLGKRPVVLFLGRHSAGKGFPALLTAWQRVLQSLPDAVLVTAGTDAGEPLPAGLDLPPDSWRALGAVDSQTRADALAGCTVFCLPSAHESFGIVYVEAWSFGKPVVCGSAAASRELVEEGVTGLWADQNPTLLAERLLALLTNPEMARQMGAAGRALQQQRYTTAAMLQTHEQVWQRLLP